MRDHILSGREVMDRIFCGCKKFQNVTIIQLNQSPIYYFQCGNQHFSSIRSHFSVVQMIRHNIRDTQLFAFFCSVISFLKNICHYFLIDHSEQSWLFYVNFSIQAVQLLFKLFFLIRPKYCHFCLSNQLTEFVVISSSAFPSHYIY